MLRMSYEEIHAAVRAIVLPEIRALQADVRALQAEITHVRAGVSPLRSILLAGFQRLEEKLDAMEQGVRRPAPCFRSARYRGGRRRP
jgi:hypothetical protein